MKAFKSDLAKAVLRAGIRVRPGVPFQYLGKWYVPVIVPKAQL
jgi:hypothetical protein